MRHWLLVLAISLQLPAASWAEPPQVASFAALPSVSSFAALPQADDPHLSPDGRSVAMMANHEQRAGVMVWHADGREQWYFPTSNDQLNWVAWKGNDRLLLSLRFSRHEGSKVVGATRLLFTDLSNSQSVQVTFREPVPPPDAMVIGRQIYQPPNLQDRVISLLPQDPQNILLAVALGEDAMRPEVEMVDVATGRPRPSMRPAGNVVKWLADPEGVVRLRQSMEYRDGNPYTLTVRVRNDERDEWRVVHRGVADRDPRFIPIAFARGSPATLFVMADQQNGRLALMPFDTVTQSLGATIAADPVCDIEPVLRDSVLVGYTNPCKGPVETYLDTGWQQDQAVLQRALKTEFVAVLDRSADGRFSLIRSQAHGNAPPTYWYFDQSGPQKTLARIADAYPPLAAEQMARTKRVTLAARDGLAIPALLTLPQGHDNGPIAFVVLPHGGPTAHDSEEFDWIVQFIASRGYGVLQPQFRGSSGYGSAFQRAGYREWGGKMQDDVTDATRWLIDQKLADPKRICIMGFSYGGYSALMGAAAHPELYQCAAAMAPVTDIRQLLQDRDRLEFAAVDRDRTVGDEGVQAGQSPVDRAYAFKVPVLLIHGMQDFTVPATHSEEMEYRLRHAGKQVTAIYLDQADHFLSRGADRLTCLKALEAFLTAQLGNGQPLSPS
jgi:dipeptidyl aminopeptidase/acylaminoacyl peptidase